MEQILKAGGNEGTALTAAEPARDIADPAKAEETSKAQDKTRHDDQKKKTEQSLEQRRAFAAARRQKEREEIRSLVQKRVDKAFEQEYREKLNPYSGKPIQNERDFRDYVQHYARELVEINAQTRPMDASADQTREVTLNMALDGALRGISELDPSVKSPKDLMGHANAARFNELVLKGYSLQDAFKLANFDTLADKRVRAARQAAVNRINGKAHLVSTPSQGSGGVRIPPETLAMYKEFFPNKCYADFQRHYARYAKEK